MAPKKIRRNPMGVEVLKDTNYDVERSVLICNTADVAFGPVMYGDGLGDAFLRWYVSNHGDPRKDTVEVVLDRCAEFRASYKACSQCDEWKPCKDAHEVENFACGDCQSEMEDGDG
jgi:hypothetical protein